jgi:hypothetical protein
MKIDPNQKYAVIYYDGCNGWRFGGITIGAILIQKFPDAHSRNNDNIFSLDDENEKMAIPTDGSPYEPNNEDENEDEDNGGSNV